MSVEIPITVNYSDATEDFIGVARLLDGAKERVERAITSAYEPHSSTVIYIGIEFTHKLEKDGSISNVELRGLSVIEDSHAIKDRSKYLHSQ